MGNKVLTVKTNNGESEIPKLDWFITNEVDFLCFLKRYNIYSSEFEFLDWNAITENNIKFMEDYLNTLSNFNKGFFLSLDYWTINKEQ